MSHAHSILLLNLRLWVWFVSRMQLIRKLHVYVYYICAKMFQKLPILRRLDLAHGKYMNEFESGWHLCRGPFI